MKSTKHIDIANAIICRQGDKFTHYLKIILWQDLSYDYCKTMSRHSYDNCKINHIVSQVENLRQICDWSYDKS